MGRVEDRHPVFVAAALRRPRRHLVVQHSKRAVVCAQIGKNGNGELGENLQAYVTLKYSEAASEYMVGIARL